MSVVAGDEDERESYMDDDDTKSIRSKKSMSVYSGVGRSISKKLGQQQSFAGSVKSGTKRDKKTMKVAKKDDAPKQIKLDPSVHQLHSDNLSEQHFVDLRQFLYKKQR